MKKKIAVIFIVSITVVLLSPMSFAQSNVQKAMRAIGSLEVTMCLFVGGKFSLVSDKFVSGVSEAVFNAYTTLANTIPAAEGSSLGEEAKQRLQMMTHEEQLFFILECAKKPQIKPYLSLKK